MKAANLKPKKKINKKTLRLRVRKTPARAKKRILQKKKQSQLLKIKIPEVRPQELPSCYGEDRLVVLVRDANWLYAYWELSAKAQETIKNRLKDSYFKAKKILRVYNEGASHKFFDIEVPADSGNWYIQTDDPGKSWVVDFGVKLPDGSFIALMRSNSVTTPVEAPSRVTDEEWLGPQEMFVKFYGTGSVSRPSSPGSKPA